MSGPYTIHHTPYTVLILFVFGAAIGSFLNVVSRRLLRGERVTGRSRCESCGKILSASDLIPLLSFFLLRGRCRYCGAKLSWQYPLVEGGTGLLFAALYIASSQQPAASSSLLAICCLLTAACCLIVIFITDLYEQRVFDRVVLAGIISALLYRFSLHSVGLARLNPGGLMGLMADLGLAAAIFAFFWFLRWVTRGRGMGEGDPPVGFLAALLTGFPQGLVAIFLAFIFGATVGVALILLKEKKFGDQIPFGPFLVTAVFATLFFGDAILEWYLGLLGF